MGLGQTAGDKQAPVFRHLENISLPEGTLLSVHVGNSGVFAIVKDSKDPEALFRALRDLLETGRIRIYIPGSGFFEPLRGMVYSEPDEDGLTEQIYGFIISEPPLWSDERILVLVERLTHIDCLTKKRYTDTDGNVFILRSGQFHQASPLSSETMFYTTLFFGPLGFHRFLSGKIFSGLLYLFTGGLFGVGWLMDLLSMFVGAQRDGKKRYFEPLKKPLIALLLCPMGMLFGLCVLRVQSDILTGFANMLNTILSTQIQQTDRTTVIQFEYGVEQFFDKLATMFGN